MYTDLERGFEPFGEVFDEFLSEIRPMPRPGFLKGMVQMFFWNLRDVDGISTKIKEVMRDQGKAVFFRHVMLCVDSVPDVSSAILCKRNDLIDTHGVDEFAMPGTLAEIDPTRSRNPITLLN